MTLASSSEKKLGSLGVAIVTPYTEDLEKVDVAALAKLTEHLVSQGHDLLVCNGTTGESPTTSDEEKHLVVKTVREAAGKDVKVLASAGTNDTRHSLKLARESAEAGYADGLLLVTPYYNKPTQQGLIDHTLAIVEETELPAMIYDIPGRAGIPINYETAVELAKHERIIALKEAKSELHEGAKLIANTNLDLYSGEDALNLPWLSVGAVGIVSVTSHLTGALDRLMIDSMAGGDLALAQELHHARAPFVDAIMNQGPGTMSVKFALAELGIFPHAKTRGPLGEVEPAVAKNIKAALELLPQTLEKYAN